MTNSKTISVLLWLMVSPLYGQTAGMLSFQGLIKDTGGNPVNGGVDLEFRIFDAQTLGSLVDMDGDGVVENVIGEDVKQIIAVSVVNGILSTKFGPVSSKAFNGGDRWLEVSVDGSPLSRVGMATAPATSEQVNIPASGTAAISIDASGNVTIPGTIHFGNSIIVDGIANTISSSADLELHLSSGRVMRFEPNSASPNIIAGHPDNSVAAGVTGATIGGGGQRAESNNRVEANFGTIGGGSNNSAISAGANISGGSGNTADGGFSTIGGGQLNRTEDSAATIAGGASNTVSGFGGAVGGGLGNSGGGIYSTVGGGLSNTANGSSATIPGGEFNVALGEYSFAAGRRAEANDRGTFVWGDSTDEDFGSTNVDQFLIRASGGVGIGTNSPAEQLDVAGTVQMNGFKMPNGAAAGHVLVSDATGLGKWQSPPPVAEIPPKAVMFFNLSTCPEGWTVLSGAEGRYVVGMHGGGTLGFTEGTALSDKEKRPAGLHRHYGSYYRFSDGGGIIDGPGNVVSTPLRAEITRHYQEGIVSDPPTGTNAPYIQLLVCEKE